MFHDFDTYGRLVDAARAVDVQTYLIALEWADADLTTRQMCIPRSNWSGHVTTPKNA